MLGHPVKVNVLDVLRNVKLTLLYLCYTKYRTESTNGRNYTNFESNLALMVIYLPVKFKFDWTKRFRVRVRKWKCCQTDKQTKNGQANRQNYTNFKSNLAMMVIYLPVKFEFDWTKRF